MGTRLMGRTPGLPFYGLLCAQTLCLLIIPAALLFGRVWGYDRHSFGLMVHLSRASSATTMSDPGTEPLVVRIDSKERWYLNSQRVSPSELITLLNQKLGRRPGWFVYLDVDSDLQFGVAVHAIDLIEATQAKVVLLTPNTKKMQ